MYILPYTKGIKKNELYILWVFLTAKGNRVWETDEKSVSLDYVKKEYLEPNGFTGKTRIIGDVLLCEMETIDLNTFYLYTENADDVWIPFFMVENAGWEVEAEKKMLGSFGNVTRIWDLCRS